MTCCVCGALGAVLNTKDRNALPEGVAVCPRCLQAIKDRQVGIVRRPDNSLYITDGRKGVDDRPAGA